MIDEKSDDEQDGSNPSENRKYAANQPDKYKKENDHRDQRQDRVLSVEFYFIPCCHIDLLLI